MLAVFELERWPGNLFIMVGNRLAARQLSSSNRTHTLENIEAVGCSSSGRTGCNVCASMFGGFVLGDLSEVINALRGFDLQD